MGTQILEYLRNFTHAVLLKALKFLAVLALDHPNSLVCHTSKSLSDAETLYLNIERALLGIVFGIEHFKHFTFGRKTHIITDQKPKIPY